MSGRVRRHTRMCDMMSHVTLIHGGGNSSTQKIFQQPIDEHHVKLRYTQSY